MMAPSKDVPSRDNNTNDDRHMPRQTTLEHMHSHDLVEFIPPQHAYAAKLSRPLRANPGEVGFVRSYIMSNWFPIIAASLGPISNLNSVIALVDPWRDRANGDGSPSDVHWVLGLNSFSLFLGCIANISLFLHFMSKIPYWLGQFLSIVGWYIASMILMSLIIASKFIYFNTEEYVRSQGYWHALITCVLYFCSATLLLINQLGHMRGAYTASFNLTSRQHSIMFQNVAFVIWVGGGGGLFSHLLGITFADGVYYCIVTVTTIGLGDITPKTDLSRALCLPFAFIGVILLGLIVATIRSIVLEAGGQTMRLHHSEQRRMKKLSTSETLEDEERFIVMRNVRNLTNTRGRYMQVAISVFNFLAFLLLGAMVFHFSEGWTYFEGIYFCSLCLLTIGYGDFAPSSPSGRPFFVVWAVAAVPLMTILISNLGDTLFHELLEKGDTFISYFMKRVRPETEGQEDHIDADVHDDVEVIESGNTSQRSSFSANSITRNTRGFSMEHVFKSTTIESSDSPVSDEMGGKLHRYVTPPPVRYHKDRILQLCDESRNVLEHLIADPQKLYEYREWRRMLDMTTRGSEQETVNWLGDNSPLRYPIAETKFFLERYFRALEDEIHLLTEHVSGRAHHARHDRELMRSSEVDLAEKLKSKDSAATTSSSSNKEHDEEKVVTKHDFADEDAAAAAKESQAGSERSLTFYTPLPTPQERTSSRQSFTRR